MKKSRSNDLRYKFSFPILYVQFLGNYILVLHRTLSYEVSFINNTYACSRDTESSFKGIPLKPKNAIPGISLIKKYFSLNSLTT